MGFMPRQTITIASGQTASPVFTQTQRWASLGVLAPSSLTEYATLAVMEAASGTAGTWRTLQSGGIDITFTAGKAVEIMVPPFPSYRFETTSGTAIPRVFDVFPRQ